MRADRLLSMLLLLQVNKKMTASQLAEELDVSKRTVYRDIDTLSGMRVPIYTEGGPGGGIYLEENYRVSLTGFNKKEIQALFLFSNNQPLQMLGVEQAQKSAIQKLQATLPVSYREELIFLQQRIYIDGRQWYKTPQKDDLFQSILSAIKLDCQLHINYGSGQSEVVNRIVQPYGLVARNNTWYLIATHDETIFRTYKLSRIESIKQLGKRFERLADFDLRDYWHKTSDQFIQNAPIYIVKMLVDKNAYQFIRSYGENNIYNVADNVIELWFESIAHARMLIMALGYGFKIIEPIELESHIQEYAQRLLKRQCE